jgi:hypothetical protein
MVPSKNKAEMKYIRRAIRKRPGSIVEVMERLTMIAVEILY